MIGNFFQKVFDHHNNFCYIVEKEKEVDVEETIVTSVEIKVDVNLAARDQQNGIQSHKCIKIKGNL